LPVVQGDADADLKDYPAGSFDIAILSQTIQATRQPKIVLDELLRIGRRVIVSFPNFGHWTHAMSILRGRMPMSREMPYQWYNTPNLHLATVRDFEDLLGKLGLDITRRGFLADGRAVHHVVNIMGRVRSCSPGGQVLGHPAC
jgi:methionine biosynthesis protein MetW